MQLLSRCSPADLERISYLAQDPRPMEEKQQEVMQVPASVQTAWHLSLIRQSASWVPRHCLRLAHLIGMPGRVLRAEGRWFNLSPTLSFAGTGVTCGTLPGQGHQPGGGRSEQHFLCIAPRGEGRFAC